jgi:CheY-like chemotaxis protein
MSLLELAHELLSMLNETFAKNIIFKENIEKDIPYISADRTQIYQALLNLYVNARDAMPNGGCITLTIEKRTGEQIREQFHNVNQDSYLCVSVTDTGEGMDETTRSRIFDPFFTTKEKGKGTGLGLSVVFGVVQTHHGFIDVESEPGKGTTFRLYLPASQTVEPIRVEEGQTIIEEIPGGTETLLVVEDEKALSELVRHLLEAKGYKVHTAQDGNEAIEVYKRYREEIDIVLTDMGLPGMVGAEVFKKLKEINPNVSVIFCSGSNEPDIKSELSKAGAKGFIQKPYNPNELLRKLREVLDGK